VYFHYRAKEQLFHDILDAQLAAFEERWSFEPAADQPADVIMANLVRAHIRTVEDNPAETRLTNLMVTMAVQELEFRDKLDKAWTVSRKLYTAVIARGIADGVFKEADPAAMANNVHALVQGYSAQSALSSEGRLGVDVDDVVRGALRMLGSEFVPAADVPAVEATSCEDTNGAAVPEAAGPQIVVAQGAVPESPGPQIVVAQGAAPEAPAEAPGPEVLVTKLVTHAAAPQAAAPEAASPQVVVAQAAAPEAAAPEAAAPEVVVAQAAAPEAAAPQAAAPQAAAPQAAAPQAAAPQAAPSEGTGEAGD